MRGCVSLTDAVTGSAGGTALTHRTLQERKPREYPEESAKRAEISAPEPVLPEIKGEDEEEDEPDEGRLYEIGLLEHKNAFFQQLIQRFGKRAQGFCVKAVDAVEKSVRSVIEERIDAD